MVSIQFGLAIIIQCLSIVLAVGLVIILCIIYDACNRSLSYFTNHWILFGIYYCPLLFCLGLGCAVHITFWKKVFFFFRCVAIIIPEFNSYTNAIPTITEGNPHSSLRTAVSARSEHIFHYSNIGHDRCGD